MSFCRASLCVSLLCFFAHASQSRINWTNWSKDLFSKAQAQEKLVILDLEAGWCHWCHVMEEKTYGDPEVAELIKTNFIAVKVDQDARPDISLRYEDYGWPATILFDSSGKEIAWLQGYIEASEFKKILKDKIANPVAGKKENDEKIKAPMATHLPETLKEQLKKNHVSQYDPKTGGWGRVHKFLFGESEELALRAAWKGDAQEEKRAKEALNKALALIDPVWGGVYQYSVRTWSEPHFEKIAEKQYRNLYLYSLGYKLFGDVNYLSAAKSIHHYLTTFLRSPEGAFYTSQDADVIPGKHSGDYFKKNDAERRKIGIPKVDDHIYSRENGWFIQGLCMLYAASGDDVVLGDAVTAANWILRNRAYVGGGFRHGGKEEVAFYLGDTLEMATAFVKLYEVTGNRSWLDQSKLSARFILSKFTHRIDGRPIGFVSGNEQIAPGLSPVPTRDENVRMARFANLLFHYTGEAEFREMAEQAMVFLLSPTHVTDLPTAGTLLADQELSQSPVHITIVGSKKDPAAKKLFAAAIKYPTTYKRVDWWDKKEGNLPNPDVKYPEMKKAAAFACTEGQCSVPSYEIAALSKNVDRLFRK